MSDLIIGVLYVFFFIAIGVSVVIAIYIATQWTKYLFYKSFTKYQAKKRLRSKENLINNYLENL